MRDASAERIASRPDPSLAIPPPKGLAALPDTSLWAINTRSMRTEFAPLTSAYTPPPAKVGDPPVRARSRITDVEFKMARTRSPVVVWWIVVAAAPAPRIVRWVEGP